MNPNPSPKRSLMRIIALTCIALVSALAAASMPHEARPVGATPIGSPLQVRMSYSGVPGFGNVIAYVAVVTSGVTGPVRVELSAPAGLTVSQSMLPWIGTLEAGVARTFLFMGVVNPTNTAVVNSGSGPSYYGKIIVTAEDAEDPSSYRSDMLRLDFRPDRAVILDRDDPLVPSADFAAEIIDNPLNPVPIAPVPPGLIGGQQHPFDVELKLDHAPAPGEIVVATLLVTSTVPYAVAYDGSWQLPDGWTLSSGNTTWSEQVAPFSSSRLMIDLMLDGTAVGEWQLEALIDLPESTVAADGGWSDYAIWQIGNASGTPAFGPGGVYRIAPDIQAPNTIPYAITPGVAPWSAPRTVADGSSAIAQVPTPQGCFPRWVSFAGDFALSIGRARSLRVEVRRAIAGEPNGALASVSRISSSGSWGSGLLPAMDGNKPIAYFMRLMATDSLDIKNPMKEHTFRIAFVPAGTTPFTQEAGLASPVFMDTPAFQAQPRDTVCANYVHQRIMVRGSAARDSAAFEAASMIIQDAGSRLVNEAGLEPRTKARRYGKAENTESYDPQTNTLLTKSDFSNSRDVDGVFHEYGHAVHHMLDNDSGFLEVPGNCFQHNPGSNTNPECAYFEGFAHFFATWVRFRNAYMKDDNKPNDRGYPLDDFVPGAYKGPSDEGSVMALLRDIWDGPRSEEPTDRVQFLIDVPVFSIMAGAKPRNYFQFRDAWCSNSALPRQDFSDLGPPLNLPGCP